jgi:tetraacyldisaccharide 4'-kinase
MPERSGLRHWVERSWYSSRPHPALRPLAALFGIVTGLRRVIHEAGLLRGAHPGVPVVVVGNLTAGGTGKTPLVLWLAEQLRDRGRKPGIVLRGYGGRQRAPHVVRADDDAQLVGDEALLLARRGICPVAIGARRAAAARLLARGGCDLVIADDGLQHLALRRDLAIVVVDGARGFGNGALLPAGPLREPAGRLRSADLVVMHGEDLHGVLPAGQPALRMELAPLPLRQVASGQEQALQTLQGANVHALAGIGNPARFFALLRTLGAHPVEHPRPDHHPLVAADLEFGDGYPIVMTEKDAVKCRQLAAGRVNVFYLPVTVVLPDADITRLLDRVQAIGSN